MACNIDLDPQSVHTKTFTSNSPCHLCHPCRAQEVQQNQALVIAKLSQAHLGTVPPRATPVPGMSQSGMPYTSRCNLVRAALAIRHPFTSPLYVTPLRHTFTSHLCPISALSPPQPRLLRRIVFSHPFFVRGHGRMFAPQFHQIGCHLVRIPCRREQGHGIFLQHLDP